MNLKIGVLVICYNQAEYISETIKSVLMQDFKGIIEMLIFDDASVDNTQEIVSTLAESNKSENIKIIYKRNKENLGYRKNIIQAFKNSCNYQYVAFCEGDDYWTNSNKLTKQVELLEKDTEIGLVYTDVSWLIENENLLNENVLDRNLFRHEISFEDHLINANYYAPLSWLFRPHLLEDINWDWITTDGTYNIMLHILRKSKIHFLNINTATHRVLINSISHNSNLNKSYLWRRGVFDVQKLYAENSRISKYVSELMYVKNYTYLLSNYAFYLQDNEFIKEAKGYLENTNYTYLFRALYFEYKRKQERKRKIFVFYKVLENIVAKIKYIRK
jgi:glycosyltransferase involved in cell wall biosynthesis